MKKTLVFLLSLAIIPTSLKAQFKILNDGNAILGTGSYSLLYGVQMDKKLEVNSFTSGLYDNIGLQSTAIITNTSPTKMAIGVLGIGGNGLSGKNFGVFGYLAGNKNGAGVFGTTWSDLNISVPGYYAAFFYGHAYVTHNIHAAAFLTTSDIRLKENIVEVSQTEDNISFLDKILSIDVLEYNYKDRTTDYYPELSHGVSLSEDDAMKASVLKSDKRHYGVSAQDLQKLFPNLVEEEQDGYLSVNYVEMVPVLLRSIQELKQEIDELKEELNELKDPEMARNSPEKVSTTLLKKASRNGNKLYQNAPNPSNEQTVIRFQLTDNIKEATICFFDLQGKMLKKIPVTSSQDRIIVNTYELGSGLFLYSLIVNGQEIDTKKMVILK